MIAPYPDPAARLSQENLNARREADAPALDEVELLIDVVRAIRNVRAEFKIEPQQRLDATIAAPDGNAAALESETDAIRQLARVGALRFGSADAPDAVRLVVRDVTIALGVGGAVNLSEERTRLSDEARETEKYLSGLAGRLGNEQFLAKAPAEVVEREKERLQDGQARLERIRNLLKDLGA